MNKTKKILNLKDNRIILSEVSKDKVLEKEIERNRFSRVMALASELGFSISLPIAGGAILGHFLDETFRTAPILTLSLIFLGLIISFLSVYLILKDSQ